MIAAHLCVWCGEEVGPDALWCATCWEVRKARTEKPKNPWLMPKEAKTAKKVARAMALFDPPKKEATL
jgi:hypothetical protein